ncbi:hypothetical protein OSTOST_22337 [Ostertagia ostertagi]
MNGHTIEFELDTGAPVSIIDEATWSRIVLRGRCIVELTVLGTCHSNGSIVGFTQEVWNTKERLREKIKVLLEENQILLRKGLHHGKSSAEDETRTRKVQILQKTTRIVENGTLIRLEHSEWATPLMVVPKPVWNIRSCGDYKVTINLQLDINQPLPKPDDLSHVKRRAEVFEDGAVGCIYAIRIRAEIQKSTTVNTQGMFERGCEKTEGSRV